METRRVLPLTLYFWLSAAYDTVNDRVLLTKLYGMTEDVEFTKLIGRQADGAIKRMVYPKGVFSHPCY